jgi:hypothetical protein
MFNQSAVLVRLNISTWTGRKLDKRVSDEIDLSKNTKTRAGNYNKHLLAGSKELDQIQKVATAVRTWNYDQTLPWSNGGDRLCHSRTSLSTSRRLPCSRSSSMMQLKRSL